MDLLFPLENEAKPQGTYIRPERGKTRVVLSDQVYRTVSLNISNDMVDLTYLLYSIFLFALNSKCSLIFD